MNGVPYLGHIFTGKGMSPDPAKVRTVQEWSIPTDVTDVCKFLGLASYYQCYIAQFSDIATPLHKLTQKGEQFIWSDKCQVAFTVSKRSLCKHMSWSTLICHRTQAVLQTDASASGLGAVLEQDGRVIAYASRTLSKSEQNYSVIEKKCLAAVYAMKQFRHYLLGRPFQLVTDHAPLQWLSAQKMERMLAIQEYDFAIMYHKGPRMATPMLFLVATTHKLQLPQPQSPL